jgi:hypothetical protein
MSGCSIVAFRIGAALVRRFGRLPSVEQVDIVRCEDGDVWAYVWGTGAECIVALGDNLPVFDPAAVETLLLKPSGKVH